MVGGSEAEVEWQVALRQVPRLSVHHLEDAPPVWQVEGEPYAQARAVRPRAAQPHCDGVDAVPLSEVADEHLRRRVERIGDDVQVAVTIEVEHDRGARAERAHHGEAPWGVLPAPQRGPA